MTATMATTTTIITAIITTPNGGGDNDNDKRRGRQGYMTTRTGSRHVSSPGMFFFLSFFFTHLFIHFTNRLLYTYGHHHHHEHPPATNTHTATSHNRHVRRSPQPQPLWMAAMTTSNDDSRAEMEDCCIFEFVDTFSRIDGVVSVPNIVGLGKLI